MNLHPLTPLFADFNDLQQLTPSHFVIGGPHLYVPEKKMLFQILYFFSSSRTLIQKLKI